MHSGQAGRLSYVGCGTHDLLQINPPPVLGAALNAGTRRPGDARLIDILANGRAGKDALLGVSTKLTVDVVRRGIFDRTRPSLSVPVTDSHCQYTAFQETVNLLFPIMLDQED